MVFQIALSALSILRAIIILGHAGKTHTRRRKDRTTATSQVGLIISRSLIAVGEMGAISKTVEVITKQGSSTIAVDLPEIVQRQGPH
eukprot:4957-Ditylum_brightwellii.AAC.2